MKRAFIFESVCILVAALFSWRLFLMWSPKLVQYQEVNGTGSLNAVRELRPVNLVREAKQARFVYEIIARKNLFHPRRQERWKIKEKAKPLAPRPKLKKMVQRPKIIIKPTLILEGIIIFGEYRAALVRDVAKPREGVKRVHAGDTIGNYKIDSIAEEQLTLVAGDGTKGVLTLFASEPAVRRKHIKTGNVRPRRKK